MKSIKYLLPLAAIAVSGMAASGIAAAGTSRERLSVVVHYGDLNLNSQAGVASLYKRIRNAAQSVCSPLDTRILGLHDAYDQCVAEAANNAVTAVGNPDLSGFHAIKGKRSILASN